MLDPDKTAPILATAPSPEPSVRTGQTFGRYLIVDRVGVGGVGEVYAAYDPHLDRRVALKVLREPAAESEDVKGVPSANSTGLGWGHLVREAQALARLSHPNVVGVHDIGMVDGRTFIAMELVEGVDLSRWLTRRPAPGVGETLRVLIEAGRGLSAAHDKGIVHRDFKPANVLVGKDGRARVSDFGLARPHRPGTESVGAGGLAQTLPPSAGGSATVDGRATWVGTPNYMAPEQYDGEPASVQTDIYAYCLTVHEALYGEQPFANAPSLVALANAKAEWVPTVPARGLHVPRRIRAVVARGLAVDPQQRWASMDALLAALGPRLPGRARRWAPALLVGAVAATVGAVVTRDAPCTGGARHLRGVWDDARRDTLRAAFGQTGLAYAVASEPAVRKALDSYAAGWTEAHARSCEAARRGEQSGPWLDGSMRCLDRRLQAMDVLLDVLERGDPVAIERALSAVQAMRAPGACLEVSALPALPALPADPVLRRAVAEQRRRLDLVIALQQTGLDAEALPAARVLAEAADELAYPPLVAEARFRLGTTLSTMGKLEEAEAALTQAVWVAHASGHDGVQAKAAVSLVHLMGGRAARPKDGLWWARYAEAELDRRDAGPSARFALANGRGLAYRQMGDYARAEAAFSTSLRLLGEAGLAETVRAMATIDNMGVLLRQQGRLVEAIETHERALAVRRAALGPEHPAVARSLNNLAAALSANGEQRRAQGLQRQVLQIRERAYGPNHPSVAITLNNLAATHFARGEYTQAERLFRRTLKIRRATMPDHPKTVSALSNVALLAEVQGRWVEAEALYEEVLANQDGGDQPRARALTLNNLGNLLSQQGDIEAAIGRYREALRLYEAQLGPDHPELGLTLTNLGNMLEEAGELTEARALQERALRNRERGLGPDHPDVAYSLTGLAGVHIAGGEPERAVPLLERALQIATTREVSGGLRGMIEFELAQALSATGRDAARAVSLVEASRRRYLALPGREVDVAAMDDWLAQMRVSGRTRQ